MDNEERRRRYKSDPMYRQRIKDNIKASRKRKRNREKGLKEYQKKWRVFVVKGKETECCSIAYLASAIKRKARQVRLWEKEGNFPPTLKYNNRRYYTQKHFIMIVNAWENKIDLQSFFEEVNNKWNNLY